MAQLEARIDLMRFGDLPTKPFNDQARRQAVVETLIAIGPAAIVETGTFRGATTEWFGQWGIPTHSAELSAFNYHFSRVRLKRLANVTVHHQDSRAMLRALAAEVAFPRGGVLFYMDAHWYGDLPLADELRIVFNNWTDCAVVVDDVEVPGDAGYGFDDYGPGRRLCRDYLPMAELRGARLFWPAVPATAETGARRGTAYLAAGRMAAVLAGLDMVCED